MPSRIIKNQQLPLRMSDFNCAGVSAEGVGKGPGINIFNNHAKATFEGIREEAFHLIIRMLQQTGDLCDLVLTLGEEGV